MNEIANETAIQSATGNPDADEGATAGANASENASANETGREIGTPILNGQLQAGTGIFAAEHGDMETGDAYPAYSILRLADDLALWYHGTPCDDCTED